MIAKKIFILFVIFFSVNTEKITFKNVTIHGYSVYTHKFKKVILASDDLKEELPKNAVFDAIEMKNQNIPVLYKDSIKDISSLDELIMEENNIEEIEPGSMAQLNHLRVIKLGKNKLKKIQNGVFNDLPVSDIDLSKNDISFIEEKAFDNMVHLLNIRMNDNKIKTWNEKWFSNTPLLTRVSFQHNEIEMLPSGAFVNMAGKKKFGRVSLTINLMFSYNKITTIHSETFEGLEEINNLWLDNNLIEDLPKSLLDGVAVRNIKLNSNKLKCIEDKNSILKGESNDIDGNPLNCECLADIKKWADENNKTVSYFYADMNCYAGRLEVKMRNLEALLRDIKNSDGNEKEIKAE